MFVSVILTKKLFSEQRGDEFVIVRVVSSCQENDGDEDG